MGMVQLEEHEAKQSPANVKEGIEFWFLSRCLVDIREGRNCSQYLTNCYLNCHVDIQPHRTQTLKGT